MILGSSKRKFFGLGMAIFWLVFLLIFYKDFQYFAVCSTVGWWASWNVFAYSSNKYMIGMGLISGLDDKAENESRVLLLLLSIIFYFGSAVLYLSKWWT